MAKSRSTPEAIAAAWPRELLGLALVAVGEVDTTQRLARALLERHLAEDERMPPTCVVALAQTAGRGRRGRSWASAAGLGLWATLVVDLDAAELGPVPLRSAVALAEALVPIGPDVRLKWPNDLVVDGRKLGGLLIETIVREPGNAWAMIGFGINLEHTEAELPTSQATSLRLLGVDAERHPRDGLTADLVGALWRELRAPAAGWIERYRALSVHRVGDRIECDLEGERVAGELVGIEHDGALRLRTAKGERTVTAGDVYAW